MKTLRTPDKRFEKLPDFPYEPHYIEVPDGEGGRLRIHYVDENRQGRETVLLMHGDLLCIDDRDYQEARRKLRSPETVTYILSRSLAERAVMAADMRRRSGEATSRLPGDIMDVNETAVREQMLQHRVRLLIHGHTHRPAIHTFELEGKSARRIVLAEWTEQGGSYLQVVNGELKQIPYS